MVSIGTMGENLFFWLCAANDRAVVTVRSRASGKTCLCRFAVRFTLD